MNKVLIAIIISYQYALAFDIKGRVVDSNSEPISSVYLQLINLNESSVSQSDGSFQINSNYSNATIVNPESTFDLKVESDFLSLTLQSNQHLSLSFYDLLGDKLSEVNREFKQGPNKISLLDITTLPGTYFVVIEAQNSFSTFKVVTPQNPHKSYSFRVQKKNSIMDSILISHPNFLDTVIEISSLNQDIGTIELTPESLEISEGFEDRFENNNGYQVAKYLTDTVVGLSFHNLEDNDFFLLYSDTTKDVSIETNTDNFHISVTMYYYHESSQELRYHTSFLTRVGELNQIKTTLIADNKYYLFIQADPREMGTYEIYITDIN